jgi:hypothetical protein
MPTKIVRPNPGEVQVSAEFEVDNGRDLQKKRDLLSTRVPGLVRTETTFRNLFLGRNPWLRSPCTARIFVSLC